MGHVRRHHYTQSEKSSYLMELGGWLTAKPLITAGIRYVDKEKRAYRCAVSPCSELARPERLIRIGLRRSSPLRGAFGVQNADAFCRTPDRPVRSQRGGDEKVRVKARSG